MRTKPYTANVNTRTLFLLMAEFGTPAIPLAEICERFFGLSLAEANRLAVLNKLPLPTFRIGASQKAPRMVHLEDLANHIDKQRQEAVKQWHRSNDL